MKIGSPLTLDLTNTRAFKTWLYQLWQSTGGTTTTAIEDIELYTTTNSNSESSQLDQVLLMQIRDELAEINKKLNEMQIRDELAEINKKLNEMQINERTVLDNVSKKIDDVVIFLGGTLYE